MPFIFPKRFLRSRDILDPAEFNQDTEPVQELLDGELDRHNFNATDLKANVFRHESLIDTSDYNAAVGESAYYDVYSTAVECSTIFEHGKAKVSPVINTDRKTPNFVKPDGGTFRDSRAGSDADGYPSIVPNTGAWSAVKDGDFEAIESEVGDIFLAMVNLARHLGVDAESALRHANRRFEDRFRLMEKAAAVEGSRLSEEPLDQLEQRWQAAKRELAANALATD